MEPIKLTLEFYIDDPVPVEDIDDLSDLIRHVIDTNIGETDYMVQDLYRSYSVDLEFQDEPF